MYGWVYWYDTIIVALLIRGTLLLLQTQQQAAVHFPQQAEREAVLSCCRRLPIHTAQTLYPSVQAVCTLPAFYYLEKKSSKRSSSFKYKNNFKQKKSTDGLTLARQGIFKLNILVLELLRTWRLRLTASLDGFA